MIKQNPFSLYDFLGYFIPGALFVYLYLLLYNNVKIESVTSAIIGNKNFQLDNFLFFIITSYSLGHLINFLSSITIERYANWKYNYPSKYLMDLVPEHKFWNGGGKIKIWKVTLLIILLPITVLDYILGEIFDFKNFYTKKADKFIIESIKLKGLYLFKLLGVPEFKSLKDYDFHRFFLHYVYESSKFHQSKLTNYVVLYGFLRTLCLITVTAVWFVIIKIYNKIICEQACSVEVWTSVKTDIRLLALISIISYIYFMAFMKFYRRYSLETLMLIIVDKDIKKPESTDA